MAYNAKRNGDNGENNNDGTNDNFSWNCGEEGATGNAGVQALRCVLRCHSVLSLQR